MKALKLVIPIALIGTVLRIVFPREILPYSQWFALDLFAVVAVASILWGSLRGAREAYIIPLAIMIPSDALIYGTSYIWAAKIALFTWSGFIIVSLIGSLVPFNSRRYLAKMGCAGAGASLLYDLWTNFGWWLLFPFYPHTLHGLMLCYAMAVPFMIGHLLSTLPFLLAACWAITSFQSLHPSESSDVSPA